MDQALKDTLNQILGSTAVLVLTQIAVGLGLLYAIDKFFKLVEEKLADDTKLEIAVWLLDVSVGRKVKQWPQTITKILDRLFGIRYPSWRSFLPSALITLLCVGVLGILDALRRSPQLILEHFVAILMIAPLAACVYGTGSIVPDYVALLSTRIILKRISIRPNQQVRWIIASTILNLICGYVGMVASLIVEMVYRLQFEFKMHWQLSEVLSVASSPNDKVTLFLRGGWIWFFPGVIYWLVVMLYAVSGLVIKAARRFDLGFEWFNRKFDIEKKPLQSIGLVAGALVAVVYWTAVIVSRVIG